MTVKRTGLPVRVPVPRFARARLWCVWRCGVYWTMGIILLVLWGLGLTTGSTEGYWVHLLLLFAMVALLLAVVSQGRRAASA
ncbi:hypothetical protein MXAN_3364 [Myxococcus xanthus DK 1622]|uniref:Uncharacterized protein n=1 Tax=Myxococcus xanthus (strain DK1622) TaxID=246197 RepID=Q1D712_MYXXD|nr:hypothetical protein MXAN_3364 [Myxococcus xanthus DK 1622]